MVINPNLTYSEITENRLSNTSYLNLFNILQNLEDKNYFFNIWKGYEVNEEIYVNTYYEMYKVEDGDYWDSISYKYYQTPYLWWILVIVNGVNNPFEYLEDGKEIFILKKEYLYNFLKEIKNIGVV